MDRKYVILIIVLLAILCWQLIQYNKLLAEYNSMKKSLSEISSSQNCSLLKEEYESLLSKYNSLNEKCSQVERRIEPYFCPEDHCSSVVIRWISRANESIDIAIYSFTLDSIGDALIKARERGVKIRVIFERDQVNQWSEYSRLKSAGIPVMLDENPAYMHNKFMVIDGKVVLTGSYNSYMVSVMLRAYHSNFIAIRVKVSQMEWDLKITPLKGAEETPSHVYITHQYHFPYH